MLHQDQYLISSILFESVRFDYGSMADSNKRLIPVQWGQALVAPVNIDLLPSLFCLNMHVLNRGLCWGGFLFEDVVLIDS